MAFEVLSVSRHGSGSTLPLVEVAVRDPLVVCGGALELLVDAPAPTSSSTPSDVVP